MLIVVFSTMVLTLALLGSTMDKILIDAVRFDEVNTVNQGKFQFQSPDQRQKYVDTQTLLHIKALGLDEPWYSPERFVNTLLKLLTLDLGKSHFFTSDSGSSSVRDIIMEKLPYTVLLFTSSTIIVSLIGVYTGAFVADKSGSIWDKSNSFFAVLSSSFPVVVGWNAHDICVCLSLPDLSCTFYTINFAFRSVLYSRLALSYDITSHYHRFGEFYCIGRTLSNIL